MMINPVSARSRNPYCVELRGYRIPCEIKMDAVSSWIADLQGKKVQRHLLQVDIAAGPVNVDTHSFFDDDSTDCDTLLNEPVIEYRNPLLSSSSHDLSSNLKNRPETPEMTIPQLVEKVSDMLLTSTMLQYLDPDIPSLLIEDASPKCCPSNDFHLAHQDLMTALRFCFDLKEAINTAIADDRIDSEESDWTDPSQLGAIEQDARFHSKRARELVQEMKAEPLPDLADLLI